ncbi:hypothetical protein OX283_001135 [Flavobacterium sp. SUN052]|uniref:hypothetical protein n=1 Tax=Flavobacterium sp. SUN052 TaxID=3002441 RepID=UPI00237E961B|nr:hypothetical protein [Flavobacterium sp. SUN052]MEC4003245.1 hypothetical protein [Flavobacterium sp. SUN052]
MKHLIAFLFLLTSFFCFSQDALTFKSTSRVFNSNNVKLSPAEVRNLFSSNPEALRLYNSGKTKQTLGNILLYGGSVTLVGKFIYNATQNNSSTQIVGYGSFGQPIIVNNSKTYSNTLLFISGAIILIAIPIKIGFSKKIKKAVSLMNEDLKNPKTGFNIESTSFISNSNGLGLSITF